MRFHLTPLVVAALALAQVNAITVLSKTATLNRISVQGDFYSLATFIVDFSDPLYYKSANGSLTAVKDTFGVVRDPQRGATPRSMIMVSKVASLICANVTYESRNRPLDGPPFGILLPMPPSPEPAATFIGSLRY